MKIEIDTSRDSPEDIKKAIKALRAIVGDSVGEEFTPSEAPEPTPGAFNMFGEDSPAPSYEDDEDEPKEDTVDKIKIVEY